MDIDKGLVVAILKEGQKGLRTVLDAGVDPTLCSGEGGKAFKYVLDFWKKHGTLPDQAIVSKEAQCALDDSVQGPALYWAEKVLDRKLSRTLEDAIVEMHSRMAKPREALEYVEEMMAKLRKERLAGSLIESLPAQGDKVIEYYEKIKNGDTGILAPWATVNDATLGFWPEDLCLFVARLGIGKTWTSIMIAGTAWEQQIKNYDANGKPDGTTRPCRVLYATTEMAKERIGLRWYAIKLKLPYGRLRKGKLHEVQIPNLEKQLYEGVEKFKNSDNFFIVGGNFDFSMESFDAAIEEAKPDIVVLDGAYLLKVPGLTRTERAANAFDELKRINKRRKVPIVVTMQFNREVKTNQAKTVQAESIALTDVAGWNADLIYGLIQTDEMKNNKRMMLKPLKVREGESEEIECNWNFDTMDFSELPKVKGSGSGGSGGGSDANDDVGTGSDPFAAGGLGTPAPDGDVPF